MKLIEDLEIVQVENNGKVIKFICLDEFNEKIYEVKFHLEKYNKTTKKYEEDQDTYEWVEKTLQDIFNVGIDDIQSVVGRFHNVYVYDYFNSFYEVNITEKFTKELKGKFLDAKITEITDDGNRINIYYDYNNKRYRSKFNYSTYFNNKWFVDEIKKTRAYNRFKDTFNVDYSDKDTLIGRTITVKVRDFNGNYYGEIMGLRDIDVA